MESAGKAGEMGLGRKVSGDQRLEGEENRRASGRGEAAHQEDPEVLRSWAESVKWEEITVAGAL